MSGTQVSPKEPVPAGLEGRLFASKDTLEFCLRQSGVWNGTNSVLGGAVMMIGDIRSLFSVPMMVFISSQGPLLYKCIHLYNATLTRRSQVDLDHLLCMVFP